MKVLLDTNALIWWMEDNPRLGPKAKSVLARPENNIIATIVSIWEITIKWRVDKYPFCGSRYITFLCDEDVTLLGVLPEHITALESLPMHHKDPFDHLIVAQAMVEGAKIITSDAVMAQYGIGCINADG